MSGYAYDTLTPAELKQIQRAYGPTGTPVVYIAGPITKPDPILNTNIAVSISDELYTSGVCVPVIPHMNIVWHMIIPHDNEYWYAYDIHILKRCDALLRLPGESVGADREIEAAKENGIPVFYWNSPEKIQEFLDWCKGASL